MPGLGEQLWWACTTGKCKDVKRLINEGADVNWRGGYGITPLMIATGKGHVDIIRLLLDHGADINKKKNNGSTALHIAVVASKATVVRLLIGRGADLHHANNYNDRTPLDNARLTNISSTIAIIEAAINSTKVIYTASDDLQRNRVTFKEFHDNIIIITDNDIPNGYEFEGHPVITLQNIQQCIGQLLLLHTDNEHDIPPGAIHDILIQRRPDIARRLQHWRMNLLHLIVYYRPILSNDMHEAISSLLTKCPQATTAVDIDGMTPLHHAVVNLPLKRISQDCHDLLLTRSLPIVVHRAIEAGMGWEYLRPIVMTKVNALTMEDEESGLVPFMLAAERCKDNNNDDCMLGSLSMVYELLCLKPDVMKEYDEFNMTKRTLDSISTDSSGRDKKKCRLST